MGLTLAQIRAEVQTNTGRTDRDSSIDRNINFALKNFTQAWFWKKQRARTSGSLAVDDISYDLPTDLVVVHKVLMGNSNISWALELRDKAWFLPKFQNVAQLGGGQPAVGYVDGLVLYFAPKTSVAYDVTLHYVKVVPTLTADTDTSLLPELDEAVIAYATAKIFASVEQFDSSSRWLANAGQLMELAKVQDIRDPGVDIILEGTMGDTTLQTDPWLDPFIQHT